MDSIIIQFQDFGSWRNLTTMTGNENSQRILLEMQNAKKIYPNKRIRAIDNDGRIVDILTE